jgi:methanogenic corrinoid protein MtbC1
MKFGDRIKKLRKAKKYSQKELGDILDLGQTTIANYEKNIRFPNPDILIKIANIFDESIDHLVGRLDGSDLEAFTKEELDILCSNVLNLLLEENEQKVIKIISELELNNERTVQLYEEVYKPVLKVIGNKWVGGEMPIAKEHYISGIIHKLIAGNFLNPSLEEVGLDQEVIGNVICMSLASEPHTLGIHMISDYFVMLGYKSYYIGSNVPTDALVDLINSTKPLILAISATMPYHIDGLCNLIQVIRTSSQLVDDIGKDITIVVGGQAFNNEAEALGTKADHYASCYEDLVRIFNR